MFTTEPQVPADPVQVGIAVKAVLRSALRPSKLVDLPTVLELELVRAVARDSTNPLDLAFAAEAAFREALERLGDGPYGHAARLLFGADQESRGLPLKTRRSLASQELGVYPSTFRKLYEAEIERDVVWELLRMTATSASPRDDRGYGGTSAS